jgi:hypothetical protein
MQQLLPSAKRWMLPAVVRCCCGTMLEESSADSQAFFVKGTHGVTWHGYPTLLGRVDQTHCDLI